MSGSKSILVVLESIDVNDSSGTKGRVALIRNLHKLGYTLKILHYTRRQVSLNGIHTIAIPERKANINYLFSRLRRIVKRHTGIDLFGLKEKHGFSFTFLNDSASMQRAISRHYSGEDMVLTLSKGSSFRPHHAMLGLPELHSKWAAYIHDPYPFHLYPEPYNWIEPGYQEKEAFFKEVSERAAISVFPSQLLLEWMAGFFPQLAKTGVVIPHQVSIFKQELSAALPEFFDPSRFNLLHSGNLMKPRDPQGLILGVRHFLKKRPEAKDDLRLILVGKADYFKPFLEQEQKHSVWLYASLSYVPYLQTQAMQNVAAVNIILESAAAISPFLPGKFPHCVQADRPILALGPEKSEVRRLLGPDYEFQCSITDSEAIADFIEYWYHRWKTDPDTLRLNRPDLLEYLGVEHLKNSMSAIFGRLEQ